MRSVSASLCTYMLCVNWYSYSGHGKGVEGWTEEEGLHLQTSHNSK